MSHLCPRGSNEADSMYLRHKNRDSVFLKNIMSYFRKIYNLTPYRESSFFWILEVGRKTILTSFHRKKSDPLLSILPRGGGQLGKDGFVMFIAKWRDQKNSKMQKGRFLEIYTIRDRGKFGKLRLYRQFCARFRQTRFFNTQEREYACPVAWGLRQKFKIEKCWILALTTFSDRLYINRGHPAMGIAISILPIHRDGGLISSLLSAMLGIA